MLLNAASFSLRTPSASLVRVLPFALFMGVLALRSTIAQIDALAHLDGRWWYAVQALLPAIAMALFWGHYRELHAALPSAKGWLLAAAAGSAIFILWINATQPWMRLGEPATRFVPEDAAGALEWWLVCVRLAGAVLVVPIMEELFWRGFLMRWLDDADFLQRDPRAATPYAIVASAGAFALAHDLWLAALLAGLMFAWLYRATRNLWVAIGAHAIANLALGIWVLSQRQWIFW